MRRPIIFVFLAGVAALVAALVVYSALKKREAQIEQAMVRSVNVVVAAKDLPIGSKLESGSLKLVRWSKDDLPPGAFTDSGPLINQFTKTSFVTNEPIVGDRLFAGDKNAGVLPLLIPNGMRAISVPVDEVSDIAGFVQPHARVDLLVSTTDGQSGNQPFSKIVLQNVEVLAVAQEIENASADKPEVVRVVTLLVTPDQAERVTLASHEGPLRMAMRNYEDNKIVDTTGVDMNQLLRSPADVPVIKPQHVATAAPAPVPTVHPVEIEIMRDGKSVESVSFVRSHGGDLSSNAAPTQPIAGAPPNGAIIQRSAKGLEAGAPPELPPPAPSAPVDATDSQPVSAAAAPLAANSGAAGFTTPHAKTIDVP
jgi:pilus assembly protein CpaB